MIKGINHIGYEAVAGTGPSFRAFNPTIGEFFGEEFFSASEEQIGKAAELAGEAFHIYKNISPEKRAEFLEAIADAILDLGDSLLERAHQESGLPLARLTGERGRTVNQLRMFADILREGSWVEAVVDTAMPDRQPLPRPDIRKMLLPIGPVAVFGASNFPLAFSTAGGDTASSLAAGNPVIVKVHPGHPGTNELVASAILSAARKTGMPNGVFSSIIGNRIETGVQLVKHPCVTAVGFTGSYQGGMSLIKTAAERPVPIPVFAEMGSINPVVVLPGIIERETEMIAGQLAASVTLGVGQFCTNPGLIFIMEGVKSEDFISILMEKMAATPHGTMLNQNVCQSYYQKRDELATKTDIATVLQGENLAGTGQGTSALYRIEGSRFISDDGLQAEVFGPSTLVVVCRGQKELMEAIRHCHGQLTGTVMGISEELEQFRDCIAALQEKVGRLIFNGVPTGVEVCHAMIHGGPFPASGNSQYTSVGADAIKRFVRPVCFQDCPEALLPNELKDANPKGIFRKVDGVWGRH